MRELGLIILTFIGVLFFWTRLIGRQPMTGSQAVSIYALAILTTVGITLVFIL